MASLSEVLTQLSPESEDVLTDVLDKTAHSPELFVFDRCVIKPIKRNKLNNRISVTIPFEKGSLPLDDFEQRLFKFINPSSNAWLNPNEYACSKIISTYKDESGKAESVKLLALSQYIASSDDKPVHFQPAMIDAGIKLDASIRNYGVVWLPNVLKFASSHLDQLALQGNLGEFKLFPKEFANLKGLYQDASQVLMQNRQKIKSGLYLTSLLKLMPNDPNVYIQVIIGNDELTDPSEITLKEHFNLKIKSANVDIALQSPIYDLGDGCQYTYTFQIALDLDGKPTHEAILNPEPLAAVIHPHAWPLVLNSNHSDGPGLRSPFIPKDLKLHESEIYKNNEYFRTNFLKQSNLPPDEFTRRIIQSSSGGDQHEFTSNLTREVAHTILQGSFEALSLMIDGLRSVYFRPHHLYFEDKPLALDTLYKYNSRPHYASDWISSHLAPDTDPRIKNALLARTNYGPNNAVFKPKSHPVVKEMKTSHYYLDNLQWGFALTNDSFLRQELIHSTLDGYMSYVNEATFDFHFSERLVRTITAIAISTDLLWDDPINPKIKSRIKVKADWLSDQVTNFKDEFELGFTKGSNGPYGCPPTFCTNENRGKIGEAWMEGLVYGMFVTLMREGLMTEKTKAWMDHYLSTIQFRWDISTGEGYDFVDLKSKAALNQNNYGQFYWKNTELLKLIAYLSLSNQLDPKWEVAINLAKTNAWAPYLERADQQGMDPNIQGFPHQEPLRFDPGFNQSQLLNLLKT